MPSRWRALRLVAIQGMRFLVGYRVLTLINAGAVPLEC